MENINRIDIYVGKVGSAYVDKETALKNLNDALQNIEDMAQILRDAETARLNAETAKVSAEQAYYRANEILNSLNTALGSVPQDDPKYELLVVLYNELRKNDIDGVGLNGGNVETAQYNSDEIDAQIQKILQIINEASGYLKEDEPVGRLIALRDQYQEEYDNALETFKSYLPEEEENENDISDQIEGLLKERIAAVNAAIANANNITEAINLTSQETQTRIEEIMNIEPAPVPVQQYTVNLVIEHGSASGSEIQTVNAGETVSWEITPDEGYQISTVDNGYVAGNIVTSNTVNGDMTVTVVCTLIDVEPEQFTVTLLVQNGRTEDEQVKIVNDGETASWTIIPVDGYEMPSSASNGSISDNVVTSDIVHANMVVTVICKLIGQEEPDAYVWFGALYGEDLPTNDNISILGQPAGDPITEITYNLQDQGDWLFYVYPASWGTATILDGDGDGVGFDDDTYEDWNVLDNTKYKMYYRSNRGLLNGFQMYISYN